MNRYTGIGQLAFYILLQMVTPLVCFFQAGILGNHQMEVNKALAS